MSKNNTEAIKKILLKEFKTKIIDNKKDLIKEEFLDSINYIKLFSVLEKKFGVEFDFIQISKIKKLTIDTLDELIKKYKKNAKK